MVLRCLCVLVLSLGAVQAQDYPSKPIRLITPAAPGGTTDLLARLFGAKLGEIFGQQIIVENRASASGVIAGEMTAKAPPDGYTLLLAYHQHTINAALNPNLPYHPVNDFTPITQLTRAGLLLVVNPSSPPRTLQEFIEWTKTRSGELNYGSACLGRGGQPDMRERIVNDGSEPVGTTPREFRDFMAADLAKWAKLVKESGAKLD